jgi:chemotaxis regulatin CheY-phosphate phosphatase CheZ
MQDESNSDFGPNGGAVSTILNQAAAMSLDDIAALATSINSISGYLGRDEAWQQAQHAAESVAQAQSRMTFVASAKDAARNCVMTAVQKGAGAKGRDADRIAESWDLYREAVASSDARRKRKAVRKLQRALIRTIGLNYAKHVSAARKVVSSGVQAVVVWDLANEQSEFTPPQRSLLMTPWASVFPVPEELSQ